MTKLKKLIRYYSTWVTLAIAALPTAWDMMSPELKSQIPATWLPYIAGVMFLAFLYARAKPQPNVDGVS